MSTTYWVYGSGQGDLFGAWLVWSLIGIGIGLGFLFFWVLGRASLATESQIKKYPTWLKFFAGDPKRDFIFIPLPVPKEVEAFLYMAGSAFATAIFFLIYHWPNRHDLLAGNLGLILLIESSLPLFLLLTWAVPVYFLERYLRKLPTRNVDVDKE